MFPSECGLNMLMLVSTYLHCFDDVSMCHILPATVAPISRQVIIHRKFIYFVLRLIHLLICLFMMTMIMLLLCCCFCC